MKVRTGHDLFEQTALRQPKRPCLGFRPWNPSTKSFDNYQWIDYQTVQQRRAAFGVGLVELHRQVGFQGHNFGVGLWCQNRPEWQITGEMITTADSVVLVCFGLFCGLLLN